LPDGPLISKYSKVEIIVRRYFVSIAIVTAVCMVTAVASGMEGDEFDSEKMLSDIEKKLQLSQEKLQKLKPALDAKSAELKKSIQESIDKGFIEFEKLSKKLDAVSKDAEKKVEQALTSEEMMQLRDYLSNIDKDAINKAKETLILEFTALLELTEEQAEKLKPILEDSFSHLAVMFDQLSEQGIRNWDDFKTKYDDLIKDLREKLQDSLNSEQMDSFENHSDELKEKIHKTVFI